MKIYVVVQSIMQDGHYVSANLRVYDSKEKAVKFIENYFGNDYERDGEFDTWYYCGEEDGDRIDIETWTVK